MQRRHSRHGFTVVELMVVVALIGVLAAIATVTYHGYVQSSRVRRAISDVRTIEFTIAAHEGAERELPASLADIDMDGLRDPWGNPYRYQDFGLITPGARRKDKNLVPLNSTYDLWSMGPDGDSKPTLTASQSRDDIIRANDGAFIGVATDY